MHCLILAAGRPHGFAAYRLNPEMPAHCWQPVHFGTGDSGSVPCGVIHFTVVVGFQDWMVKNFLKRNFPSLDFTFVVIISLILPTMPFRFCWHGRN